MFKINFVHFVGASLVGRAARFYLVALLLRWLGPRFQPFLEKYFEWLALAFGVLLVGGFVIVKWLR